jgi:Zn-dependent protease with chaperone function
LRFVPPGPRLHRSEEPTLFAILDDVAETIGGRTPDHVYVDGSMNAGVFNQGGFMGFGARRALVLGLPLLRLMSVQELRTVVAHEYAHFYRGDTHVGAWIARMEREIRIVVDELASRHGVAAIPIGVYGLLVEAVTNRVSRRQELFADEVAAHAFGGEALAGFLRKVPGWRAAWDVYLGQRTSVAAGRNQVLRDLPEFVAARETQQLQRYALFLEIEATSARGTHPPLRERLARLAHFPNRGATQAEAASSVIRSFADLEFRLFVHWGQNQPPNR